MILLKHKDTGFLDVLYSSNKLINNKNNIEKNISEELLTFRTLIFVPDVTQLSTEELLQIDKIMSACKLQKEQYKIHSSSESPWSAFRNQETIKEIILFGVSERQLNIGIQLAENQINKFDNKFWIKTASISQIINSQDIKNNLWQNALKPHFTQPQNA